MSLENPTKINLLFSQWPKNAVYLTSWLKKQGYSSQLLNRYKKSRWVVSIGTGAVIRNGDHASIEGAVYALQKQADMLTHPGGKTALGLLGKAHYLEFSTAPYILFGGNNENLPIWVLKYNFPVELNYYNTSFLPAESGLIEKEINGFSIKLSGAARAMMECLYLAPEKQDLINCYKLMEGLNNLHPNTVQQLLESCKSVKVKRLFLYMATKAAHPWLQFLNTNKIDLGSGKRQLVKDGIYVASYKITVPKALENDEL